MKYTKIRDKDNKAEGNGNVTSERIGTQDLCQLIRRVVKVFSHLEGQLNGLTVSKSIPFHSGPSAALRKQWKIPYALRRILSVQP